MNGKKNYFGIPNHNTFGAQQRRPHDPHADGATGDAMPPFEPDQKGPLGGLFAEEDPLGSSEALFHKKREQAFQEYAHETAEQHRQGHPTPGQELREPGTPIEEGDAGPADELSQEELTRMCKERVCPSCPVKKEADETALRALADLDNARKRLAREKEEHSKFAAESILNDIIPALDNLDLALQHAPEDAQSKNFVIGVEMTRKLLIDALKRHGLNEVGTVGEAFDPAKHEAVGTKNVPEFPEDHICSLLTRGYSLSGRLLRPARVIVCKHDS